jgi:hypothetical protein
MAGFVIVVVEHDYETALDALDRSLALSPSSALALGFSSIIRAWTGDDATSIAHAETGIRLSPYDPLIYLPFVGLSYAYFLPAASRMRCSPRVVPRKRTRGSVFRQFFNLCTGTRPDAARRRRQALAICLSSSPASGSSR